MTSNYLYLYLCLYGMDAAGGEGYDTAWGGLQANLNIYTRYTICPLAVDYFLEKEDKREWAYHSCRKTRRCILAGSEEKNTVCRTIFGWVVSSFQSAPKLLTIQMLREYECRLSVGVTTVAQVCHRLLNFWANITKSTLWQRGSG